MKRAIVKSMAETTAWRSHCQFMTLSLLFTVNVIHQMAPPLSKVDSNKFWCDIQNEENLIYAKFGKDVFNISKVIGRKTKRPRFFGLSSRCTSEYHITWMFDSLCKIENWEPAYQICHCLFSSRQQRKTWNSCCNTRTQTSLVDTS